MNVRVVRDLDGFASLREVWQPLLDRCEPNHVFMTWEWAFTWWKHFGKERNLFVVVIADNRETVGILPLMLFNPRPFGIHRVRYLHFIGYRFEQRWNDWMDIIAVRKKAVISAALEFLVNHQELWDFLDLWDIREDSDTLSILSDVGRSFGLTVENRRVTRCPYLSTVGDWQSYYNARPKITGDPDIKIRRLKREGVLEVQWIEASHGKNLGVLFDLYERQQASGQKSPMFSKETYRDFYRELVKIFPAKWIDLSFLKLNGTAMAAHFGFRYRDRLYYVTPVFDPAYSRFSPGKVLLRYIINNCFADDEVIEFDFLVGAEPYKYEWATGERCGYRVQVSNASMSGRMGQVFRRIPPCSWRSLIKRSLTNAVTSLRGMV